MKKILFIAYYYPPIKSGGGQRPLNFIKYLKKNNYDITLLTSTYKKTVYEHEIIRVFDISFNKDRRGFRYYVWLFLRLITECLIKVGFYSSIYSWWKNSVVRKSEKIIEFTKPDLIIVSYPPVETLEIGLFLSKKFNIPLISDFRDGLLFESIESKLLNNTSVLQSYYTKLEKKVVKNSLLITTVSAPISEYFKTEYKTEKVFTVYTGYDSDDYLKISGDKLIFERGFFNIVFTGRLNLSDSSNGIGSFFDVIAEIIREDVKLSNRIRIYLAGEFSKNELMDLKYLIDKKIIVLCGNLNRLDALIMQKQADLLLVITSITRSSIVTTKIFEYLKAGKPILALTYGTELEKIINDTNSGWVVHPFDGNSIKKTLIDIINDEKFYNSIKLNEEKIKFYSSEEQIRNFSLILKKKINKN